MILQKSSFYQIHDLKTIENKTAALISIDAKHAIFEGHFPGQPVVPGVCMLQIIKEIAEIVLDKKIQFQKIAQIKYLKVLFPDNQTNIRIQINWKAEDKFDASISQDENQIMKMQS